MNRKIYAVVLSAITCLTLVFLASCSSSGSHTPPPPPTKIAATSGTPQNATVATAFGATLVATVTKGGTPQSGVSVTFTAPAAGASGTFMNGTNKEVDMTGANGQAVSTTFTANNTAGAYNVTASATGAAAPVNFSMTNNAGAAANLAATSGTPQNVTVSATAAAMVATVTDTFGNPVSGVAVTFTAPAAGATGTFTSTGTNTENDNSDASGHATASDFVANSTTGGPYIVTATSGALAAANFSLTNTAAAAASHYSFYVSGADTFPPGYNFVAIAGAVTIDAAGIVTGGEQDYNDAFGVTSPEPSGDTITGGTLIVNAGTGQGTLTLVTNNASVGVAGTETFGVQFANTNHALIMQFDGSATSSGSMDLQTLPSALGGGYAFTLSGVDSAYNSVAFGGVFSVSGASLTNGNSDVNDNGTVKTGKAFTGTFAAADAFGRGQLTGISFSGAALNINYYIVGPEVIRIIDVDAADSAVGSAFGQGANATSANNAALGSSVFAVAANPWSVNVGALGQFTTSNTGSSPANLTGVADDNEVQGNGVPIVLAAAISGTYNIASDGYGSMTIGAGQLGNVSALGLYMTDPNLNLNDPNNTASGLGGALLVELDSINAGATGIVTPQTDTATASFAGNYAVGWQDFNDFNVACGICEFDMVAQGSVTAGAMNFTGLVSDPFNTLLISKPTSSGDVFTGTPTPDGANPGRYTLPTASPLAATIGGAHGHFEMVMYQASGAQLYWLDFDNNFESVGTLEQQGSLTGLPAARKATGKTKKNLGH